MKNVYCEMIAVRVQLDCLWKIESDYCIQMSLQ